MGRRSGEESRGRERKGIKKDRKRERRDKEGKRQAGNTLGRKKRERRGEGGRDNGILIRSETNKNNCQLLSLLSFIF